MGSIKAISFGREKKGCQCLSFSKLGPSPTMMPYIVFFRAIIYRSEFVLNVPGLFFTSIHLKS